MYQTGVGTYIRNLLHYLIELDLSGYSIYVYARDRDIERMRHDHPQVYACPALVWRRSEARWHGFAEQITYLIQLTADRLDLMHFTYSSWPILYPGRFVATVHDLTQLQYETGRLSRSNPLWYWVKSRVLRLVMHLQVQRAQVIMVPTRTVADEVVAYFAIGRERVVVQYEGATVELPQAMSGSVQGSPYLLYVGNFYPHKNVDRLIEAYRSVVNTHGHILRLVGPDNEFARRLTLSDTVVLETDVSQQRLSDLYAHASALVSPSLAEGFGLPVVEAMSRGIPLILSDIPVYREIAGDSAQYFDPRSVEDIARVLEAHMSVPAGRRTYDMGRYSFAAMARSVYGIYLGLTHLPAK